MLKAYVFHFNFLKRGLHSHKNKDKLIKFTTIHFEDFFSRKNSMKCVDADISEWNRILTCWTIHIAYDVIWFRLDLDAQWFPVTQLFFYEQRNELFFQFGDD